MHWLAFPSVYRIGALRPYCLAVWAVTVPVAWYVPLEVLTRHGGPRGRRVGQRLGSVHAIVLTTWFLALAGVIVVEFWTYWSTLLR